MQTYIKKITLLLLIVITLSIVGGCSLSNSTAETTLATTTAVTTASTTASATTTLLETTSSSTDTTSSTVVTTNSEDTLAVLSNGKLSYTLYSPFDNSSIVVALVKASGSTIQLSNTAYTISGFDSSTPGEQIITVSYRDISTTFTITILDSINDFVIDMAYYASADGLLGQPLLDELHDIINTNYQGNNYTFASTALSTTDRDPSRSSNIILVYTGASVSGTWDSGDTWNKEHVWPQSLLGEVAGGTVNMASDLHNLKPSNPIVNSNRGNKYFDLTDTAVSFEPRDEVKGDIARILFYMMTMYEVLELIDGTPSVHQMGRLSVLLDWNDFDPVDDFERTRNEAIYGFQNNRNPYIDYPGFVDLIFDHIND